MLLKQKIQNAQGYITAGMLFFLFAILANMIADGRLIGRFLTVLISEDRLLNTLQGFADGFSLPMLIASILFNLRGLMLRRTGQ